MVSHLSLAGLYTFLDLMGCFDSSWNFLELRVQPPRWTGDGTTPLDLRTLGCPQSSSSSSSPPWQPAWGQRRVAWAAEQGTGPSGCSVVFGNISRKNCFVEGFVFNFSCSAAGRLRWCRSAGRPTGSNAKRRAASICFATPLMPRCSPTSVGVPTAPERAGCCRTMGGGRLLPRRAGDPGRPLAVPPSPPTLDHRSSPRRQWWGFLLPLPSLWQKAHVPWESLLFWDPGWCQQCPLLLPSKAQAGLFPAPLKWLSPHGFSRCSCSFAFFPVFLFFFRAVRTLWVVSSRDMGRF